MSDWNKLTFHPDEVTIDVPYGRLATYELLSSFQDKIPEDASDKEHFAATMELLNEWLGEEYGCSATALPRTTNPGDCYTARLVFPTKQARTKFLLVMA